MCGIHWCGKVLVAAGLILSCGQAAYAQPSPSDPYADDAALPPAPTPLTSWQTLELGKPNQRYKLPVYANRTLNTSDLTDIRRVVIIIHGVNRDADHYYNMLAALLDHNPLQAQSTLILAPRFSSTIDTGFADMVAWHKARWEKGANSTRTDHHPVSVSAFQVLDDVLGMLNDRRRLPALNTVVLAGHSGGAQLVQRYAVLNATETRLRQKGLTLRYVVANPSSYLYLSNKRPDQSGTRYVPYERGICPDYNDYKYGLEKRPKYVPALDKTKLFIRYAARNVTYLLGGADNNPEHRLLDKSCAAEAQGSNRLARGNAYLQYESLLAARSTPPIPLQHMGYEVQGVGHNSKNMFGSSCGVRALLGEGTTGLNNAAACTPIPARKK